MQVKTVNYEVEELWTMHCPECGEGDVAPFNHDNPMQPMIVECGECGEKFKLTYEKD